jgi:menaquinone-dependent protoporphyrinogen IX oxidase
VTYSSRILIFYAEAGAGHRRAAEALAQPLSERGAVVTLVDAMRFTHPVFRAA